MNKNKQMPERTRRRTFEHLATTCARTFVIDAINALGKHRGGSGTACLSEHAMTSVPTGTAGANTQEILPAC